MNENIPNNGHVEKNGHYEEYRTLSFSDYIRILRRWWWIIVLGLLIVLGPTAYYTFTTEPIYQSSTTIMVQEKTGMQQVLFEEKTYLGRTSTITDQVYLLKSHYIAEQVIQELMNSNIKDSLTILQAGFTDAVQLLRSNLFVSPVKDTNFFIELSVKGRSPFEVAYLANAVARVYQNQDQELSQGEIREVVEFLNEQLQKKEKELKQSEEHLKSYQEQENIVLLSGEAQETVNQLAEFESLYNSTLTDLQTYKKRLEYLNQKLGLQKENLKGNIAQISSPLILKLREELAESERNAALLIAQNVSEQYPELKTLRNRQKSIKQRLIDETQKLIISGLMPDDPLANAQELVGKVIEVETEIHTLNSRADALKQVVE
ncbi:MAG: GumC family protein, partial [bacterium]